VEGACAVADLAAPSTLVTCACLRVDAPCRPAHGTRGRLGLL